MVQRTVLKVDISCQKCKTKVLKAVSTLEGKPYVHFVLHYFYHVSLLLGLIDAHPFTASSESRTDPLIRFDMTTHSRYAIH
jgi:hypothetical protein